MAESSPTSSEPAGQSDEITELVTKGGNLLQEDKVDEAQACFESALKLEPENEKVLGLLGLTHFRLEDFSSASGVYELLVKMNPDDASYHLNLGLVHLKLNRPSEAIEELNRSRDLDPTQLRTVSYLGLAHARNGDYADAYECFLRADQDALATEMEQYLDDKQQDAIRERVSVASEEDISFSEIDSESSIDIPLDESMDESVDESVDERADERAEESVDERSEERSRAEFHADVADDDDDEFNDLSFAIEESGSGRDDDDDDDEDDDEKKEIGDDWEDSAGDSLHESSEMEEDTEVESKVEITGELGERRSHSAAGVISQRSTLSTPAPMFADAANGKSTPDGHAAPLAVAELAAERMMRPSEGGEPLEIGPGGVLVARVMHRLIARTQGVMVSSGELGFEPATRRIRGQQSDEVFGLGDAQLFVVTGEGYLVASARDEIFSVTKLDGDVVYLREEYVFAFDPDLRWENGRIPGSNMRIAHFRGQGCVAIRTPNELLSVKLSPESVVYVESEVLAGWIGQVVPRFVKPAAGGKASAPFVECSGEGVVLLHDHQAPA